MVTRRVPVFVVLVVLLISSLAGQAQGAPRVVDPPGTVQDVEALPPALGLAGVGEAYRVTYRSTDSRNDSALVTGVVFVPKGPAPAGGWPVVSWTHGTVGLARECAPSATGYSAHAKAHLEAWIAQGYAVVATDYVIPGDPGVHPYLDGGTAARNAVDLVRAAHEVDGSLSPRWVAVGHSQGGHAALFTGSSATRHAPGLDYRGAVAVAPASGIVEQLVAQAGPTTPDTVPAAGIAYFGYVLRGLKAARPDFDLAGYLTPAGEKLIAESERRCLADLIGWVEESKATVGASLSKPMSEGRFAEIAHPVMDVPLTGYDRPLFIAQGTEDTDIRAAATRELVGALRAGGNEHVTHTEYAGQDHRTVLSAALPDATLYVRNLLG
ncbi:alpha/beta hydrolase [Actinosynnema sp. CS-041913]|uniref:alpha/beta hydrolase n=1 Tax=Actinosynnema sp. CS-041913 TaxID=3239917 RepID=UPI003D8E3D83